MTEMILEHSLSRDGMRVIHAMGGQAVSKKWLDYVPSAAKATEKRWEDEAGMHHLLISWLAREIVPWTFQGEPWVVRRNVALWYVEPGQRVSEAIVQAAEVYALGLGKDPAYAFMRQLPGKVEDGFQFSIREGGARIMFVQHEWVPERFVMLDSGGERGERKLPGYLVSVRREERAYPSTGSGQRSTTGEAEKQLKLV